LPLASPPVVTANDPQEAAAIDALTSQTTFPAHFEARNSTSSLLADRPRPEYPGQGPVERGRDEGLMSQTAESTSAALAASHELLETVLRHLYDGIIVTAVGGDLLYANDEAARLTGYRTADDLLAAGLDQAVQQFEILRLDGRPLDPSELPARRALAGDDPEPMLVRFRAAGGGPDRISDVRAVSVRDESGALQYVISIFAEVTAERTLAERERISAGAAEALGTTLDYDGILSAITGFAVTELADGCAVDVIDGGGLRRVATAGIAAPGSGLPERVVREREALRDGASMSVPLISGEQLVGVISFEGGERSYDENDLRLAAILASRVGAAIENALLYLESQRTSALLDSLYGSAPIGLGFWDRELRYVRVNDALARINNRPAADHVGRPLVEVIPQLAHVIEPIARRVLDTRRAVVALEMTGGTPDDPDAARHWLASYYPVLAPDGEPLGVGGIVEEITERRRAEQRAELQYAVTRILVDADSVEIAVPLVLETVCGALGWDIAAYWPVTEDRPRVVWSLPGSQLDGFRAMTERVSMTAATLPGRVARSGRAEWLERLTPDLARASIAAAEGLVSGVAFPIFVEGQVVGVAEAYSSTLRAEDDSLLQLLAALGGQLGQFLSRKRTEDDRAALFTRERLARAEAETAAATLRKLERVAEVALKHLTLADLLQALLARIVEVLEADTAAILLVGSDGKLTVRADVGLAAELEHAVAVPLGAGLAGRVAASRSSLLVPDLSQVELVSPVLRERGVNSLVAIPLVVDDRVIGVVHVGSEAYAQFDDSDVRLLELIADRIALAINQASLYEAERAAQERLRFLSEASIVLASSLDLDETLHRAAELAVAGFADAAIVDLVDGDAISRVVIEVADPSISRPIRDGLLAHRPSPADTGGSAKVIRTGEPEILLDLDADPSPLQDATRGRPAIGPTVELLKPRSLVYMPLIARGHTLGVLALIRTTARFDQGDVETVRELAARVAVAVDNAQLYRAAEERAQAARVLASVGDGVFLVDRHGLVRTWNRAAAAATGLADAAVIDRVAVEAIPGWGTVVARVPLASEGGVAPRPESLPLDLGGRELWLSIHGVVVPDGIVYAFRDLTEERALEAMRTEFVSTVSHELRTPLAAIYGAAMTLRRSDVTLADEQRANLLDVVSGEADRLARTVNDILWASRLDTDSLHVSIQNCDPVALVSDVVEAQRAHLGRGHELTLIAEPELPQVAGDPDKVGRVLINLVDNAVKYSPDGGTVTVTVSAVGAQVRFSVHDEGLGVPLSEQRRIFDKFYRLDPNMNRGVGGTGLGLYICRELVRRMDGRIWVTSAGAGAGSTFAVELPVAGDFAAHLY
jgi:signal transduction histidine kinase/putative methionine-R-sulfoxide reductase with GAF domain